MWTRNIIDCCWNCQGIPSPGDREDHMGLAWNETILHVTVGTGVDPKLMNRLGSKKQT